MFHSEPKYTNWVIAEPFPLESTTLGAGEWLAPHLFFDEAYVGEVPLAPCANDPQTS